ncbi:MAG: hypothetical protein IPM12_05755 [Flavobacteriales bacterium]|nr:hypothetical protein [Flavobacteriales bacterium]
MRIAATALFLLGPVALSAQCDLSAYGGMHVECGAGQIAVGFQTVSIFGGTPPFTGWWEIAGQYYGEFNGTATTDWYIPVGTPSPDGQYLCGPTTVHVEDGLGCTTTYTSSDCIYWIDPANQFIVGSDTWDVPSGTSTLVLLDNPSDPGNVLNEPETQFYLERTDLGTVVSSGTLQDILALAPPRLVLPGLPPGDYTLVLLPSSQFYGSVYCEGAAISYTITDPSPQLVSLRPVMMLGGATIAGGLMGDQLRTAALLPLTEPYTALGFAHVGGGGEATTAAVLNGTGPNAIVDWVVVELRSATDPAQRLATRCALLQRDGDVVGTDGMAPVTFAVSPSNYRVSVRHRNHLGVMTASAVALSAAPVTVDLSTASTAAQGGADARVSIGWRLCLWPGDASPDGTVRYVGNGNDRDPILTAIGGSTPTNTVSNVYSPLDVNLDGVIKYIGANNDRDVILTTIGGSTPNNVRVQQLP